MWAGGREDNMTTYFLIMIRVPKKLMSESESALGRNRDRVAAR